MRLRRLQQLREDKKLTQAQLSKEVNIEQRSISNYELGVREIPLPYLTELALFFNTSTDYILEITDERVPHDRSISIDHDKE